MDLLRHWLRKQISHFGTFLGHTDSSVIKRILVLESEWRLACQTLSTRLLRLCHTQNPQNVGSRDPGSWGRNLKVRKVEKKSLIFSKISTSNNMFLKIRALLRQTLVYLFKEHQYLVWFCLSMCQGISHLWGRFVLCRFGSRKVNAFCGLWLPVDRINLVHEIWNL